MKKSGFQFLPLLGLLTPGVALAQAAANHDLATDDGYIVVTANRQPMRLDQVGQSVTVLDAKAIEASQQVGVTELVAQTPGVQFARNGGPGKATSIYIRGAETGQTVILYDGVRLHDPSTTDGGASLVDVVTGDVGRIEVLRGAQSTLYGSQAIGGVINIITRTPSSPFEANGQLEAGSLNSYLAKAAVGGKSERLSWRLGATYTTTDGVSASTLGAGGVGNATEADGYQNLTVSGRLNYTLTDHVELDLRSIYAFGRNDFDSFNGDAPVYGKDKNYLGYAGVNFDLFGRLKNRVAYGYTSIGRVNYDNSAARTSQPVTFDALGQTNRYEYQGTLVIAKGYSAVFGIEHADNKMRTASPTVAAPNPTPIRASDNTTGYYLQLNAEPVEGLTITGGLRHEDHSTFGGSTVGSASVAYTPNGGHSVLRASWAQGFKAPSLYQLYSQYGNTALAPESAESWDVGFEHWLFDQLSVSAVYFHRDTTNLINFASCTSVATHPLCADKRSGFYLNVGKVQAQGIELGTSVRFGAISASANYTYLDAKNTTPGDPNLDKRLARRPRNTFNSTVSYTWPFKLVTAASVHVSGNNYNDAANKQPLRRYTLVDFRLSYPITDKIELYGRVENALDEKYATILTYGSYPRTASAGVRVKL